MRICFLVAAILAFVAGMSFVHAADKAEPSETKKHEAIEPTPREEMKQKHSAFTARAKKGDVDLLFMGDSLTLNWNKAGKKTWDSRYGGLKAANFGIGGDRTQHALWRLQNGELDGITPKVVVLCIGTNNIGHNSPEQIAEGVKACIDTIVTKSAASKVLLVGLPPRSPKPTDTKRVATVKINELIAKFDDGKQVRFLNFSDKMLDKDGGFLPGTMRDDAVHLEVKGYEAWGEAMQKLLEEMMK